MNKTLYQLAYRNIKKFKKHYIVVFLYVLSVTLFFHSFLVIEHSYGSIERLYNEEHYGSWYMKINTGMVSESMYQFIQENTPNFSCGYWYDQGVNEDLYRIGYMDQDALELCHISLVDGRIPQKQDEIMVSIDVYEKEHYQIGQQEFMAIQSKEKKPYKIVGVIKNSQDIFPQIYTHKKVGQPFYVSNCGLVEKDKSDMFSKYETTGQMFINDYGYDHYNFYDGLTMSSHQITIFIETILISIFVVYALNSTSLKRRIKEFALLRGIGMTSKQLIIMVLDELLICALSAIVLGSVLSFILEYIVLKYFESQMGYFVFQFDIMQFIYNNFIVIIIVIISSISTVYHSAQSALSGSFDGRTFQYIQVRYRRLKKQNCLRLAIRELKAYKRVTLSLFVFLLMISTGYTFFMMNSLNYSYKKFDQFHYLTFFTTSLDDYEIIQKLKLNNTRYFEYSYEQVSFLEHEDFGQKHYIVPLSDNKYLKECCFDNGKPNLIDDDKVYVNGYASIHQVIVSEGNYLNIGDESFYVGSLISPNEKKKNGTMDTYLYNLPVEGFYISQESYDRNFSDSKNNGYIIQVFFDTQEEALDIFRKVFSVVPYIDFEDSDYPLREDLNEIFYLKYQEDYEDYMSPYLIGTMIITSMIFCYSIHKSQVFNQSTDYSLMHLLGMTKKKLYLKQFYKALIISSLIICVQIFWIIFINIYEEIHIYPTKMIILTFVVVLLVNIVIYCLPLYQLLKEDYMQEVYGNE